MLRGGSGDAAGGRLTVGGRAFLRTLAVVSAAAAIGPIAPQALAQAGHTAAPHRRAQAPYGPVAILYQADKRSIARFLRHAPRRGEYIFSESAPINEPPKSNGVTQQEIVHAINAAKARGLPRHLQVKYAPAFNLWSGGLATIDDVDQYGNPVVVTLSWTGRVVKVINAQGKDVTKTSHIKHANQKSLALIPQMAKTWRNAYAASGLKPDYFALNETPSHLGYRRDLQHRLALLLKYLYRPDPSYQPLPGILYVQRSSPVGFPRGGSRPSQEFRLAAAETTSFIVEENWAQGQKFLRSSTYRLVHDQYSLYDWMRARAPKLAHRFVVMDSSYRGFGSSAWHGCPRNPHGHRHYHRTKHGRHRENPASYMSDRQARAYVDKVFQVVALRPHGAPRAVSFGPVSEQRANPMSDAAMNAAIRGRVDHQLFR